MAAAAAAEERQYCNIWVNITPGLFEFELQQVQPDSSAAAATRGLQEARAMTQTWHKDADKQQRYGPFAHHDPKQMVQLARICTMSHLLCGRIERTVLLPSAYSVQAGCTSLVYNMDMVGTLEARIKMMAAKGLGLPEDCWGELLEVMAQVAKLADSCTCAGITAADFAYVADRALNSSRLVFTGLHKLQPVPEGAPQSTLGVSLQFLSEEAPPAAAYGDPSQPLCVNVNKRRKDGSRPTQQRSRLDFMSDLAQILCEAFGKPVAGKNQQQRQAYHEAAMDGTSPACISIISPLLRDLVEQMLQPDPSKRLTPARFCAHVALQVRRGPYLTTSVVILGGVLQDSAVTEEQRRAIRHLRVVTDGLSGKHLARGDKIEASLGPALTGALQNRSAGRQQSSGSSEQYDLGKMSGTAIAVRNVVVHDNKLDLPAIQHIFREVQTQHPDRHPVTEFIESVVLVRMLKDDPTCGKPGAPWVVQIKGQVKRALDKWALDLQNTLIQHKDDAELLVYQKKLEPLYTCTAEELAAASWCAHKPAAAETVMTCKEVLAMLKDASAAGPQPPQAAAAAGPAAATEPPGALTVAGGAAPTVPGKEWLAARGLVRWCKSGQLLRCRGTSLVLVAAVAISSSWQQEILWPCPACLPAAARLALSLSVEHEGLDFCLQQVEAVLLACVAQGFAGPLVLLLLHAAINLRLQAGDHPSLMPRHPGLPLPSVMGLVEHLVPLSLVLDGTPAATLEVLQASCYWWAATSCTGTSSRMASLLADWEPVGVPDGGAAAARSVHAALQQRNFSAALQAVQSCSCAVKGYWATKGLILAWRKQAVEAAAAAAAGSLSAEQVVQLAVLGGAAQPAADCSAQGPCLPPAGAWPGDPLSPKATDEGALMAAQLLLGGMGFVQSSEAQPGAAPSYHRPAAAAQQKGGSVQRVPDKGPSPLSQQGNPLGSVSSSKPLSSTQQQRQQQQAISAAVSKGPATGGTSHSRSVKQHQQQQQQQQQALAKSSGSHAVKGRPAELGMRSPGRPAARGVLQPRQPPQSPRMQSNARQGSASTQAAASKPAPQQQQQQPRLGHAAQQGTKQRGENRAVRK